MLNNIMLWKLINEVAKTAPEKTAIVQGQRRLSYRTLLAQIYGLSIELKKLNIKKGDKVIVLLPNGPELIVSFFAIAKLGAQVMFLSPTSTQNEINNYIISFTPNTLLTDYQRASTCNQATIRYGKRIKTVFIERLLSNYQDWSIENKVASNYKNMGGDFLYSFSSGSTGSEKVVCHTQRSICYAAAQNGSVFDVTTKDRILCLAPLYIVYGIHICVMSALGNGATLVFPDQGWDNTTTKTPLILKRLQILQLIQKEKVTILPSVPYIYQLLSEMPISSTYLSSLRLCLSAGERLSNKVFNDFKQRYGHCIKQHYGSTETGLIAVNTENGADLIINSVGKPVKGVNVQIVDDEGQEVPVGTVGRIRVRSFKVATEYVGQPKLSAETFKDGWFVTDDLGKMDRESRLYLVGRVSDWIEIGGYKIDPHEVEQVLLTHEAVEEAVVVGMRREEEIVLKAVIVVKSFAKPSIDGIKEYCWKKLSSYKVPQVFEFRESLPRNASGKVKRVSLKLLRIYSERDKEFS